MANAYLERKAAHAERITVPGTDLEVHIGLADDDLALEVRKAGRLIHRVVVEQATGPVEQAWIVDLFARSDRVCLTDISAEADDYLNSLDIAQG